MKLKSIFSFILMMCCMTMTAQETTYSGNVVADEGAWCWFADPRALHFENEAGTINATYLGYIDYHGSIKAKQIDWKTKTTSEVLIRSWFQPDDHDNPAFLVLPDERIMIIYSRHTDEACFYYRISKRPGDITCLGDEKKLVTANNTTYPNPFILSSDPDHIYMCWRGIGWHPTVAQMSMPDANDDVKFTWGPYQMVQSTGARPYAKYISNGVDKIYLSYTTGHPDNEYPNWLYCNVFNVKDKCLYDVKGNKLSTVANGTFKVEKTSTYKTNYPNTVVDATSDRRDWIWNMAFDDSGNPVIGMTKISNDKQNHDYYYAKWNGTSWNSSFIANGGKYFHHSSNTENCYSAGMAIDRDNVNVVYCGVPVNGIHEIWKYTLDSNGKVTASEAVTKNSTKSNARPFVIEGTKNAKDGADKLRLSWMNGDYYYWIVNTTYKQAYPTKIMAECSLPKNTVTEKGATVMLNDVYIDPSKYSGDVITAGDVTFGVNSSQYSYIKIGRKTYTSQNVLGTADSWQTENTATTGGKWFTKTKLGKFNLTLTKNGKYLTVYVNGIIDQQIDCDNTTSMETVNYGDGTSASGKKALTQCLTPDMINDEILKSEIETINLPAKAVTDIVVPSTTASGKTIEWTSSNDKVLSSTGIVVLPKSSTTVTLTANVNGQSRDFKVSVQPRNIYNNVRARFEFDGTDKGIALKGSAKITDGKLDLTTNTSTGFSSNGYALVDQGLLKDLRSYTVILTVTPSDLGNAPRFYDFGGDSGNSMFLRGKDLSAGIKYNGGTTTMANAATQLSANKEYKLAVTFDAASKVTKIYVDGVESVSSTVNQNEPYMIYESAGDARNYIGRTQWWDGTYASSNVDFKGTIDNFVVYDIALTQKEVCDAQSIPFQEKEYKTALENGGFEDTYSKLSNSGVSTDRAIYVPKGWDVDYTTRNENDLTALKSGDLYYSNFFSSKAQNAKGEKQTMWIRQRWGSSSLSYFQEIKLPAGRYSISADIFSSDKGNSFVFVNNEQKKVSTSGKWESVSFEIETDGDEVYKVGCLTQHQDSDAERICGFDNFVVTKLQRKGDVNGDGFVNISDVTALVNVILGKAVATEGSYVNSDDVVDISDVTALVNLILGK